MSMDKTLGEVVLEHAQMNLGSTGEVCKIMGLSEKSENFGPANLYWVALNIISKWSDRKKEET